MLRVTARSIRRWEADECRPDVVQLAQLAQYYEVTVDSLVFGERAAA